MAQYVPGIDVISATNLLDLKRGHDRKWVLDQISADGTFVAQARLMHRQIVTDDTSVLDVAKLTEHGRDQTVEYYEKLQAENEQQVKKINVVDNDLFVDEEVYGYGGGSLTDDERLLKNRQMISYRSARQMAEKVYSIPYQKFIEILSENVGSTLAEFSSVEAEDDGGRAKTIRNNIISGMIESLVMKQTSDNVMHMREIIANALDASGMSTLTVGRFGVGFLTLLAQPPTFDPDNMDKHIVATADSVLCISSPINAEITLQIMTRSKVEQFPSLLVGPPGPTTDTDSITDAITIRNKVHNLEIYLEQAKSSILHENTLPASKPDVVVAPASDYLSDVVAEQWFLQTNTDDSKIRYGPEAMVANRGTKLRMSPMLWFLLYPALSTKGLPKVVVRENLDRPPIWFGKQVFDYKRNPRDTKPKFNIVVNNAVVLKTELKEIDQSFTGWDMYFHAPDNMPLPVSRNDIIINDKTAEPFRKTVLHAIRYLWAGSESDIHYRDHDARHVEDASTKIVLRDLLPAFISSLWSLAIKSPNTDGLRSNMLWNSIISGLHTLPEKPILVLSKAYSDFRTLMAQAYDSNTALRKSLLDGLIPVSAEIAGVVEFVHNMDLVWERIVSNYPQQFEYRNEENQFPKIVMMKGTGPRCSALEKFGMYHIIINEKNEHVIQELQAISTNSVKRLISQHETDLINIVQGGGVASLFAGEAAQHLLNKFAFSVEAMPMLAIRAAIQSDAIHKEVLSVTESGGAWDEISKFEAKDIMFRHLGNASVMFPKINRTAPDSIELFSTTYEKINANLSPELIDARNINFATKCCGALAVIQANEPEIGENSSLRLGLEALFRDTNPIVTDDSKIDSDSYSLKLLSFETLVCESPFTINSVYIAPAHMRANKKAMVGRMSVLYHYLFASRHASAEAMSINHKFIFGILKSLRTGFEIPVLNTSAAVYSLGCTRLGVNRQENIDGKIGIIKSFLDTEWERMRLDNVFLLAIAANCGLKVVPHDGIFEVTHDTSTLRELQKVVPYKAFVDVEAAWERHKTDDGFVLARIGLWILLVLCAQQLSGLQSLGIIEEDLPRKKIPEITSFTPKQLTCCFKFIRKYYDFCKVLDKDRQNALIESGVSEQNHIILNELTAALFNIDVVKIDLVNWQPMGRTTMACINPATITELDTKFLDRIMQRFNSYSSSFHKTPILFYDVCNLSGASTQWIDAIIATENDNMSYAHKVLALMCVGPGNKIQLNQQTLNTVCGNILLLYDMISAEKAVIALWVSKSRRYLELGRTEIVPESTPEHFIYTTLTMMKPTSKPIVIPFRSFGVLDTDYMVSVRGLFHINIDRTKDSLITDDTAHTGLKAYQCKATHVVFPFLQTLELAINAQSEKSPLVTSVSAALEHLYGIAQFVRSTAKMEIKVLIDNSGRVGTVSGASRPGVRVNMMLFISSINSMVTQQLEELRLRHIELVPFKSHQKFNMPKWFKVFADTNLLYAAIQYGNGAEKDTSAGKGAIVEVPVRHELSGVVEDVHRYTRSNISIYSTKQVAAAIELYFDDYDQAHIVLKTMFDIQMYGAPKSVRPIIKKTMMIRKTRTSFTEYPLDYVEHTSPGLVFYGNTLIGSAKAVADRLITPEILANFNAELTKGYVLDFASIEDITPTFSEGSLLVTDKFVQSNTSLQSEYIQSSFADLLAKQLLDPKSLRKVPILANVASDPNFADLGEANMPQQICRLIDKTAVGRHRMNWNRVLTEWIWDYYMAFYDWENDKPYTLITEIDLFEDANSILNAMMGRYGAYHNPENVYPVRPANTVAEVIANRIVSRDNYVLEDSLPSQEVSVTFVNQLPEKNVKITYLSNNTIPIVFMAFIQKKILTRLTPTILVQYLNDDSMYKLTTDEYCDLCALLYVFRDQTRNITLTCTTSNFYHYCKEYGTRKIRKIIDMKNSSNQKEIQKAKDYKAILTKGFGPITREMQDVYAERDFICLYRIRSALLQEENWSVHNERFGNNELFSKLEFIRNFIGANLLPIVTGDVDFYWSEDDLKQMDERKRALYATKLDELFRETGQILATKPPQFEHDDLDKIINRVEAVQHSIFFYSFSVKVMEEADKKYNDLINSRSKIDNRGGGSGGGSGGSGGGTDDTDPQINFPRSIMAIKTCTAQLALRIKFILFVQKVFQTAATDFRSFCRFFQFHPKTKSSNPMAVYAEWDEESQQYIRLARTEDGSMTLLEAKLKSKICVTFAETSFSAYFMQQHVDEQVVNVFTFSYSSAGLRLETAVHEFLHNLLATSGVASNSENDAMAHPIFPVTVGLEGNVSSTQVQNITFEQYCKKLITKNELEKMWGMVTLDVYIPNHKYIRLPDGNSALVLAEEPTGFGRCGFPDEMSTIYANVLWGPDHKCRICPECDGGRPPRYKDRKTLIQGLSKLDQHVMNNISLVYRPKAPQAPNYMVCLTQFTDMTDERKHQESLFGQLEPILVTQQAEKRVDYDLIELYHELVQYLNRRCHPALEEWCLGWYNDDDGDVIDVDDDDDLFTSD